MESNMQHNAALSTKNIRSVCNKLSWNIKVTGNAKPSAAIERKGRAVSYPVRVIDKITIALINGVCVQ